MIMLSNLSRLAATPREKMSVSNSGLDLIYTLHRPARLGRYPRPYPRMLRKNVAAKTSDALGTTTSA